MKKILFKALLFIAFFVSTTNVNAQSWSWATNSTGDGEGVSVATDGVGNVIIAGYYSGSIGFWPYSFSSAGTDVYVAKYDANGNLIWARSSTITVGANALSVLSSVYTDAANNVYITGYFDTPTIAFGTNTLTNNGNNYDIFVVKYDASGNVLWAKSFGGSGLDVGNSVSTDNSGNSFLTGNSDSPVIAFGSYTLTNATQEIFVAKLDPNGNVLWAKNSTNGGSGNSISADASGNSYITGTANMVTSFGTFSVTNGGVFLTKYDPNGNTLWVRNSGSNNGVGNSVSADAMGNAYIAGYFNNPSIVFGNNTLTTSGAIDVFVAKYDLNGNLFWARNAVTTSTWGAQAYCASAYPGGVFISGSFGTDTTVIFGTNTLSPAGYTDPMFIANYDANGNVLYATGLASGGDDQNALSVDKFCNVYVTSDFWTNPFIIGPDTLYTATFESVFVAKLITNQNCQTVDGVKILEANFNSAVYPNPNSGSFKIHVDQQIENGRLILVNTMGQRVHEQKISQDENEVNVLPLPNGIYQYVISENERQISTGKILIEKED